MAANYRGITLLPVMAKILSLILASRISDWAETEGILHHSQFGFRAGLSTIDAIFVLQSLWEISKETKSSLYCCFVDLQKAFDSINHNKLWAKLHSLGLRVKIISLLKNMYSKASACVTINGAL